MDYEYYYDNARSRYYNACSEINSCENTLGDLRAARHRKIDLINRLKTDVKNNQEAYESMIQIIQSDEALNSKIVDITKKTNEASLNYSSMVSSSSVINKDLNDVYSNELTTTKRTLSNILDNLKTKRDTLKAKIIDLKNQLRQAESELQDINNRIRTTEANLQDWRRTRSSASLDMEYYRRKMNEAV